MSGEIRVDHSLLTAGNGREVLPKGNRLSMQVVVDFYTQMSLEGRVFQVRAGAITTPFIGDVPIADTAAEMAVSSRVGTTIIPCYATIGITLLPGTANQVKLQSVAGAHTAGDAFVPLPLLRGGVGSACIAAADETGGVTVPAETGVSTSLHYSIGAGTANSLGSVAEWKPVAPPVLPGASCFYVQIGGTTTGPSYFAAVNWIELPAASIE